ncbi:MAG TPA: permease-like cell division protein FtsX [Gemmatimonadales bacterium]|nr:permease-like cell division protein FtsX [Gemmatimonadales bacterium]
MYREALFAFRRAPLLSALSITSIAFSLFTVGLFGLVALNLREALRSIEERVEVVAFVMRGTPPETVTLAAQDIQAFPEVAAVTYVSEDQALARARKELVEFRDAYRDLATNPLPASLEIHLKPGYRDARHVAAVAERLKGFRFVDDIRYGRDWIERLDHLRNVFGIVGFVIGLAFAAVAVVIIGVTIRLTILQRAREIAIMRLVGATDGFIRGPFLLEGMLKGALGGLLSVLLCWLAFLLFRDNTGGTFTGLSFFDAEHMALLLLFGILLGLGGSLVSVGRHLREVGGRMERRRGRAGRRALLLAGAGPRDGGTAGA